MKKPTVLLAIDRFEWSFDHIAKQLKRYLSDEFDISIVPYPHIRSMLCDILVAFWWPSAPLLKANTKAKSVVTCIYDGYSWRPTKALHQLGLSFNQSSVVAVANDQFAQEIVGLTPKPVIVVEDGIDCEMFRSSVPPSIFTAGWTGNSKGVESANGPLDLKGLRIIKEACQVVDVPLALADAADAHRVHAEMPEWFKSISVYVCASECEGTPNPILEAMASGRPIVTTNVGLVSKLIKDGINGRVVKREPLAFAAALRDFKAMPRDRLIEMGHAARVAVEAHAWERKMDAWRQCLRTAWEAQQTERKELHCKMR
jgi:hypothetical protein